MPKKTNQQSTINIGPQSSETRRGPHGTVSQQSKPLPQLVRVKLDLSNLKLKYAVLFLAVATGVAGAIIAIYAYTKFTSPTSLNIQIAAESERLTPKEIKALTDKVSQIAVLPEDETPTVLTVSDLTKLHANPFFVNAKLKDKILIFKKAERIILYDPLGHKIVNMGPYSENQSSPPPSPAAQYESPKTSPTSVEEEPSPEPTPEN